jgi:hypothetical protein
MNVSQVYAIVIGGIFCVLLLISGRHWIAHLVRYLSPLVSKHLIYRYVLHRHQFLGLWSGAGVLVQLIYIIGNICSFGFQDFSFRASTISQAGFSSRNPLNNRPDPSVRWSSPQLSRRSAGCNPQHVSADSSVGRRDGGFARCLQCASGSCVAAIFCFRPAPEPVRGHNKCTVPRSHSSTDTRHREPHHWDALFCSLSPSFADPPTNSSSAPTMPCRRSPPTPSGNTCHPTSPFPAATCTSRRGCFCSCASSKAVSSSTRMASSGIAVREPTSRTYMVRSGSAYSVRRDLTSKLGTSISGFLPSASGLSCKLTHSWWFLGQRSHRITWTSSSSLAKASSSSSVINLLGVNVHY